MSTNNLAAFYQASGRPGDALPLVQRLIANGRANPAPPLRCWLTPSASN